MKTIKTLLTLGVLATLAPALQAQTFNVNIATTGSSSSSTPADQLFSSPGVQTVPGASASRLWFVVDSNNDGLPVHAVGGSGNNAASPASFLGADDFLLQFDLTPGQLTVGDLTGRFQRNNIAVSSAYNGDNFYAVLWGLGDSPTSVAGISGGMTFDTYHFGTITQPPTGNANARIFEPMVANQFVVVPEPQSALLVGLGLAGLALVRRRMSARN